MSLTEVEQAAARSATDFYGFAWGHRGKYEPAGMVALARGVTFTEHAASGEMHPSTALDAVNAQAALMDVAEWLGFGRHQADLHAYITALSVDGPDIFRRVPSA